MTPQYEVEFYADDNGRMPVREWLLSLPASQRRAVGQAIHKVLQRDGINVCGTEFGKQLSGGLFEFRVRAASADILKPGEPDTQPWKMLVRIFCHAHGNKLVLLLGGYDKARDPSPKRQEAEIRLARTRLKHWAERQRRADD
jgi:phage-related protein